MRKAAFAQRVLAIATTPDRAAAVVGDLLEEEPSHGRHWFWLTVARTALAFVWLGVVRIVSGRHAVFSGADIVGDVMNAWRFVWKRKWLVVVPIVLFTTATSLVAYSMPVRYRSEALLRVVPQRVPESLVRSTLTFANDERLLMIAQTILTRTQLERIILELNLYQDERRGGAIMEDVVERMRRSDITISTEGTSGLRVSFIGDHPRVAKEVTEKLTNLFISENVRNRGNLAEMTSAFLKSALEDLRRKVDDHADKVAQAKAAQRSLPRSQEIEYEEVQNRFRVMLTKFEEARLTKLLEIRSIGEQIMLVDPARVPNRPDGPDRLDVSLSGATAGFGLGLVLLLASSLRRTPPSHAVTPPA